MSNPSPPLSIDFSLVVDEHIMLSPPRVKDAVKLFELVDDNRDHLRRFLGWLDGNRTQEDTEAFISGAHRGLERGTSLSLAIWYLGPVSKPIAGLSDCNGCLGSLAPRPGLKPLTSSQIPPIQTVSSRRARSALRFEDRPYGQLVGMVGFNSIDRVNRCAEMGYWIDQGHQGQGIMRRSVRALTEYGFIRMGLHRIEIRCDVENKRSEQIPVALGFSREGVLRGAEFRYGEYFDTNLFALISI